MTFSTSDKVNVNRDISLLSTLISRQIILSIMAGLRLAIPFVMPTRASRNKPTQRDLITKNYGCIQLF